MCGITCVVGNPSGPGECTNHDPRTLEEQLNASLDIIEHRGPDARGVWVNKDNTAGIAHCRLSINDLRASASQPLHSSNGDIHAVVNGEIYDFDRLQTLLSDQFGYKFHTSSDSEVALALYEHYGLEFLSQLRGEFAICIYDARKKLFVAARDRHGIKPLFWTIDNGRLLVAAEMKAFLGLGWQAQWDVASIVEGGWHFDDRTMFKGVKKLPPGHYLTYDEFGNLDIQMYWDIKYPDKLQVEPGTEEEMIEGVREHLLDAIRLRLRADVRVGVYLSGGIDSSAIAGMAAHLVREKGARMGNAETDDRICCFSIAFDEDSGFDESERTAQWLNVRFLKKQMTELEIAKRLEDATWHCEHHNQDLNFIGKFALSELPQEHGYKVVLTGEGADENFAGYPMYIPDFLLEQDHAWKQSALEESERKRLKPEWEHKVFDAYDKAMGANGLDRSPSPESGKIGDLVMPTWLSAFHFRSFAKWTAEASRQDPRTTMVQGLSKHARDGMLNRWHPMHSAMYMWQKVLLANNLLTCLGDRSEMAHSIEARPPFLDHVLTGYANALPPSLKLRYDPATASFTEKWILREAARPFITDELYTRTKHAYTAPTKYPRNGPLHQLFQRLITEETVKQLGFVDWERARHFVEDAFGQGSVKSLRDCLMVGQWVVLAQRFKIKKATPVTVNGVRD